jgi:hypothetical protein
MSLVSLNSLKIEGKDSDVLCDLYNTRFVSEIRTSSSF